MAQQDEPRVPRRWDPLEEMDLFRGWSPPRCEREGRNEQSRWVERSYGSFSRSFTLPSNADTSRVRASFQDGVLGVEIPKAEARRPEGVDIG